MVNRDQFRQDEARYVWLPILLDAYEISDRLMAKSLASLSEQGTRIACQKGCYACCLNPAVPILSLELMGISWYAGEKLKGTVRQAVKHRLYTHNERTECPFLISDYCSIYPMRPLICRQFYIKSKACAIGEDVLHTRPNDIVGLTMQIAKEVSMRILDFYGIKGKKRKEIAFEEGFMATNSKLMHLCDWTMIGKAMDLFDNEVQE
jgi:Fe-S-cluster containining protein